MPCRKFLRAEQIGVAPGRAFRGVAELLEGIGEQRAGGLVVGIGEHQMAHGLRDEAKFALGKILCRAREDRVRAAHILDIFPAGLDRRQRIEIDRIGVVPAEIFLVDRLHIVPDVAVIAARLPGAVEARRQADGLGDLGRGQPVVHQADGLVMRELVEIALLADHGVDPLMAPHRPMMLAAHRVRLAAPHLQGLAEIFRPGQRVAHVGAAERQQIVEIMRAVFREIQQLVARNEEVHLRRRLAVRRHLEFEFDPVDDRACRRSP